jgi:hypothetical protein
VKKRVLAAALWFVALSSLGGFTEVFFGVPADLGSYLGIAAAIILIVDPARYAWGKRRSPAHLTPAGRAS